VNFQKLLRNRFSVREYTPEKVDPKLLNQILLAAQFAPTAANRQPFKLIVIHTEDKREEIKKIYDREWFSSAPILICACGIPELGWVRADGKSYIDVDVAIVLDHISLAAADLGLGTCWVASFNVESARKILRIPQNAEPIAFMSLGYPAGSPGEKERKTLEELVSFESWETDAVN